MINIQTAELIIGLITFFLVYVVTVSCAGSFRAWVAAKMGDSTAQALGFLTLNPLMHIDSIGVIFLFIFYFGWGRYVPINPLNIVGRHRGVKLVVAFFSESFAYFTMALAGLIVLVALFNEQIIMLAHSMIRFRAMSHLYIAQAFPEASSLIVSIGFILVAFVYLNLILGVLRLLVSSISLALYWGGERFASGSGLNQDYMRNWVVFILPIVLIIFFSGPLQILILNIITYVGVALARMLHML